ncbi:TetR/AcrR family transcriptional regulator [Streptomyces sp. BV129]|uniref:TetR/AcrR family transcriptional regulator n=1 Tax=Streptomyces sp. BV129 TaxID=2849671 RepID=UPI001C2E4283|nr:TetR/AcrR family transcriptional regulator [Streptomyces sp. BV129]MBV1949036.1 TetR/AcrR family transcriptional regulator [Streptomyces sp. BV129]
MTAEAEAAVPLARGTRPRNRRELVVAAARELFSTNGYANVAMSDIAAAVGIGPSALYRHFRGKQEVLHAVVAEALESCLAGIYAARPGELDALVEEFAATALARRELGVLWQREARHLSAEQYAGLGRQLQAARRVLVAQLTAARPRLDPAHAHLLAWCTLGVAVSVAYQHVELPAPDGPDLIARLMRCVATADLPELGECIAERPGETRTLTHRSRREALLAAATELFAERGYASVSLEDTGAAVGIAGQSIYNHFTSKHEILATAVNRGVERLWLDLAEVLASAQDDGDALRLLVSRYVHSALVSRHLVTLIATETEHLQEEDRLRTHQFQRDYIAEWLHLMHAVHPAMSSAEARVRVQAVITIVNDVARTPRLRSRPGLARNLHQLGCALLGSDSVPGPAPED